MVIDYIKGEADTPYLMELKVKKQVILGVGDKLRIIGDGFIVIIPKDGEVKREGEKHEIFEVREDSICKEWKLRLDMVGEVEDAGMERKEERGEGSRSGKGW